MSKILIINLVVFYLSLIVTLGQKGQINEKQIKKIIAQSSKGEYLLNHEWKAFNKNSSFYKSDTIKFYNLSNYYVEDGCNYVIWKFRTAKEFVWTDLNVCNEPPIEKSLINLVRIKFVRKKGDNLYLLTFNRGKLLEKFLVNDFGQEKLRNGQISYFITLVRE